MNKKELIESILDRLREKFKHYTIKELWDEHQLLDNDEISY